MQGRWAQIDRRGIRILVFRSALFLRIGPRMPSSARLEMTASVIFILVTRLYLDLRSPFTSTNAQKDFLLSVKYCGTSEKE